MLEFFELGGVHTVVEAFLEHKEFYDGCSPDFVNFMSGFDVFDVAHYVIHCSCDDRDLLVQLGFSWGYQVLFIKL